jgi:hypothetical protein
MRIRKIAVVENRSHEFCARQNFMREIELMPGLQGEIEPFAAGRALEILFMRFEKFGQLILEDNRHDWAILPKGH